MSENVQGAGVAQNAATDAAEPVVEQQPVQSIEQDGDAKTRDENSGDVAAKSGDPVKASSDAAAATSTATPTTAPQAQAAVSEVTADQWRSMMDVVMAIYDFREEECVNFCLSEHLRRKKKVRSY